MGIPLEIQILILSTLIWYGCGFLLTLGMLYHEYLRNMRVYKMLYRDVEDFAGYLTHTALAKANLWILMVQSICGPLVLIVWLFVYCVAWRK